MNMATELQFIAIAAFLLWCLVSALCGVLNPEATESLLIRREHGPTGWTAWREVHFGLTAADRRILAQPEPIIDARACTGLFDTVLHQSRRPDSDAVQFAIVRPPLDGSPDRLAVLYVSAVRDTTAEGVAHPVTRPADHCQIHGRPAGRPSRRRQSLAPSNLATSD